MNELQQSIIQSLFIFGFIISVNYGRMGDYLIKIGAILFLVLLLRNNKNNLNKQRQCNIKLRKK